MVYLSLMRRSLTFPVAVVAATASLGAFAGGALAKPPQLARHTPAAAVTASAKLYLHDAFFVDHETVDVPGRAFSVSGYVSRYVPGQRVTLTATLGTRRIVRESLRVRRAHGGRSGSFTGSVTAPRAGVLHLTVVHRRDARMHFFSAGRGVVVVPTSRAS